MNTITFQFEWALRLILSTAIGMMIGYERHARSKDAGVRTHAIVAMASALLMIISKYGFFDVIDYDASRVASQIITGIGFLGAGLIFVRNDTIQGLTTAAGIWATSAIGMAIGAGLYGVGILSTVLFFLVQYTLQKITSYTGSHTSLTLIVEATDYDYANREISQVLKQFGLSIIDIMMEQAEQEKIRLVFYVTSPKEFDLKPILDAIHQVSGVSTARLAKHGEGYRTNHQ